MAARSTSARYSTVSGLAEAMPAFPHAGRPIPESAARRRLVHGVAVAALAITAGYLGWRVVATIDLSFWWVALPMLALELHNALGLAVFTVALWDVDAGPRCTPRTTSTWSVAVLIPTYDEPVEVLLPTVAAAVALEPAHATWVLDDGRRPEVAALARSLGAQYLSRPDNRHAKAGNLNHALGVVDADIVAVLDADHVARPGFLTNTLGYFDDPRIALVQTPQDFYNIDSFEHQVRGGRRLFNEQAVFYRVIAAAKNRWGAAFWCGTGALVRTAALRDVGGVATGTVTEDIHTTIRLHRRGWRTVYHNEVLARGLAARTASEYLLQRRRWATGAMQVLRQENPLFGRGLTLGQRLGYASTLWAWFDAWRSLGYIVLPIVVISTGAVPIHAPLRVFGPLFLAALGAQCAGLRLLARGHYPPVLSILFEFLRMPAVLSGTLALVGGRERTFAITPKGATGDGRSRAPIPRLVSALLVASLAASGWMVATLAGLTPMRYPDPGVAVGACAFLAVNASLLGLAALRIHSPRFAPSRRNAVRLPVLVRASLAGTACVVADLSLAGARVVWQAGRPVPQRGTLVVQLPAGAVALEVEHRRTGPATTDGGQEIGVRYVPGQTTAVARLALALLAGDRQPPAAGARPPVAAAAA